MKGEVVYLYAYDVANEIITSKVPGILRQTPTLLEIRTDHTLPKDIPLYKPLALHLDPIEISYEGDKSVVPVVHIYEVGIISIVLRIPFEVNQLGELISYHNPVLSDGQTLDDIAKSICLHVLEEIKPLLVQPSVLSEPEAYTVFCINHIEGHKEVQSWVAGQEAAIAELLTESKPGILSQFQIEEVLRFKNSYAKTDMAVIDWDSALVVDLTGYTEDVLYVLELANLQLEEYKVMDKRLDRYLETAYDDIKKKRFAFSNSYRGMLRTLRELRMDITKLNDEVAHITKFLGDWYLARIYLAVRERFHLRQWKSSVEERIKQLDTLYTVVNNDISNIRMLWLEAIIVILFAIDIIGLFLLKD